MPGTFTTPKKVSAGTQAMSPHHRTPHAYPASNAGSPPSKNFPLSGRPRRPSLSLKIGDSSYNAGGPSSRPAALPRPIRKPRKILYLIVVFFCLYWFGVRHGLGIERALAPPLGFAMPGRKRTSSLEWGSTGMATLQEQKRGVEMEHPIYELMERAETRWNTLRATQSTTLEEAVEKYRRRYHIPPPKGFDVWWKWCEEHGVTVVDEYDQMMKDILPHHALEPETFIARSLALEAQAFTYTLDIDNTRVELLGETGDKARPKHLGTLIRSFLSDLPEGFRLRVTGSDHDVGSIILGRDQRDRAMELVKLGQHFSEEELKHLEDPKRTPAFGWFKACPLDSPANTEAPALPFSKSFIYNHLPTMDFCDFPEHKHLHGAMHIDYAQRSPSVLKPVLILSKFPSDSSFQITPMEAYTNTSLDDLPNLPKWEEKTDDRIFWRGSTTGGIRAPPYPNWRESHRLRLHLMVNGEKGNMSAYESATRNVLLPNTQHGFTEEMRRDEVLSKAYTDIKLSGGPVQCNTPELCSEIAAGIEFGEKVTPRDSNKFKYALDVDGNGWSSRFHRLLTSGSAVVKMTMFPEWNQELLTPWYHYIPLKPDYSDLYDIMAFFAGPVDENGVMDTSRGHDYLARKIGEAGQRFALEHWSWVNMQAYIFRLLLELQRLHTIDRESMNFHIGQ